MINLLIMKKIDNYLNNSWVYLPLGLISKKF